MILSNIEKAIIKSFFAYDGVSIDNDEVFFSNISVKSRNFTGAGFFTDFNESQKLKISNNPESYKWGHLGAKLNLGIDTGYLPYIENGYVKSIEGYVYDGHWPENINEIQVYYI